MRSNVSDVLPYAVKRSLAEFGGDLATARRNVDLRFLPSPSAWASPRILTCEAEFRRNYRWWYRTSRRCSCRGTAGNFGMPGSCDAERGFLALPEVSFLTIACIASISSTCVSQAL